MPILCYLSFLATKWVGVKYDHPMIKRKLFWSHRAFYNSLGGQEVWLLLLSICWDSSKDLPRLKVRVNEFHLLMENGKFLKVHEKSDLWYDCCDNFYKIQSTTAVFHIWNQIYTCKYMFFLLQKWRSINLKYLWGAALRIDVRRKENYVFDIIHLCTFGIFNNFKSYF